MLFRPGDGGKEPFTLLFPAAELLGGEGAYETIFACCIVSMILPICSNRIYLSVLAGRS